MCVCECAVWARAYLLSSSTRHEMNPYAAKVREPNCENPRAERNGFGEKAREKKNTLKPISLPDFNEIHFNISTHWKHFMRKMHLDTSSMLYAYSLRASLNTYWHAECSHIRMEDMSEQRTASGAHMCD